MKRYVKKYFVVVVNKMDSLEQSVDDHGANAKKYMLDFVTHYAADSLGVRPVVFPISAKDAVCCKTSNKTEKSPTYDRFQFKMMEEYLQTHHTANAKKREKLLTHNLTIFREVIYCLELLEA